MKHLLFVLFAFATAWPANVRAAEQAALGTPFVVSSYHWTTYDGIQSWGAISLMSPTGQWYSEDSHFGLDCPDGASSRTVTLNETGIWQVWNGYGYAAPQSGTTYYQPGNLIQVGPVNLPPTITWNIAPGSSAAGQGYNVTAHGHDDDGNLTQVNVWKNGQPFAFAGGGNGMDGDSGNWTNDPGPQTVTFTAQAVDADGATSPLITHTVTIDAVVNQPPTVTLLAPGAQTITAGTVLTIASRATDPDGNISNHNLDIQRPTGDWNFQGGFAAGEPFQGGAVGSAADSTRSAGFTFTDVGTYYVRAAANDGSGWYHSGTVAITVIAPPPAQFALVTVAGAGGAVSAGGTYTAGTTVMITATPSGTHDFTGWSGDAGGSANPLAVLMDRAKTVQAGFAPKNLSLTTNASVGGNVTPGGNYPYGTTVTIAATPDAAHYFTGWTGDAAGPASPIAVLLDRAKFVQAQFAPKAAQSISFTPPGDQNVGAALPLTATSSSGLPVSFVVLGGPATFSNGTLTVTGPGSITIQAVQPGDAYTLAAPPITGTFNAAAPAVLKYHTAARTLLQTGRTAEAANYVIGNP
ncbi:MAG: hypothetical protein JNG82_11220 [Opitutaceae bacterium]|nr:hypothetical protein [Opitutaceae bacterium]